MYHNKSLSTATALALLYPVLCDNAPLSYHFYNGLPPSADCMHCCMFMYSIYLPYIAGAGMPVLSKGNHPSSVIGLTQEGSGAVICIVYRYQHAVVVVNIPSIEV